MAISVSLQLTLVCQSLPGQHCPKKAKGFNALVNRQCHRPPLLPNKHFSLSMYRCTKGIRVLWLHYIRFTVLWFQSSNSSIYGKNLSWLSFFPPNLPTLLVKPGSRSDHRCLADPFRFASNAGLGHCVQLKGYWWCSLARSQFCRFKDLHKLCNCSRLTICMY